MVRLTDRPDMTIDVYLGRKTTIQLILAPFAVKLAIYVQGPVVQSIVSLTSSLSGQLVECFTIL